MNFKIPTFKKRETDKEALNKEIKKQINQQFLALLKEGDLKCAEYTSLDQNPTIITACQAIASLVGLVSWHIMENTDNGDRRIKNELSRKIDIDPNSYTTRADFFEAIAMNMLLYGNGNAVVRPHTENGYLRDLEVVPMSRVTFVPDNPLGYGYWIYIDGIKYDPRDLLHFRLHIDKDQPWKGRGIEVSISDVANNLKQAAYTEKAYLSSEYKPPLIVNVNAMGEEFQSKDGRDKIAEDYLKTAKAGQPWIIPAEQMNVTSVKPLTLQDLAISDTVKMNKETAAAIVGVPAFLVGVGEFKKDEYNNFITTTVREIVEKIQQTMTKGLILSPNWYVKGNIWALLDWDLQQITTVFTQMGDRGWVSGNEARDRINLEPKEGLDELKVLENYIPASMSGNQNKLNGGT